MSNLAISAEELESSLQKKEGVLILDLRSKEKFMEGHIPTSANVATDSPQQKQSMLSKVPAAFKIILVDDGSGEAEQYAGAMSRFGYRVHFLKGGISEWKSGLQKSSQAPAITGDTLYSKINNDDKDIFLLDVREPMEFSEHKIPGAVNIPLGEIFMPEIQNKIPKDKKIVTICSHGNRSMVAAFALAQKGIESSSLTGGMAQWNQVLYDTIAKKDDNVTIIQVEKVGKGCISHIIGCDGEAAVIDPTHPASKYVEFANKHDLKITKVLDTHQHADHVSATRELASQTGATLYYSAREEYKIQAEKLDDGNELKIGSKKLNVIHTPGHTAGSMTFIFDNKYVFSGDILFVEGIGRPDLRDQAEQFAQELYDTLHNKLLALPTDSKIFPTHHGEGVKPTENGIYYTTVEMAKKLQLLDLSKDEFVKKVVSITTPRPMNYAMIIKVNKGIIPPNPMMIPDLEMGPNRCSVQ
ncbi:MAG TPA: rhodanese-like domain-containing protein [Nitrosopumilaceae archaeon]|nr:rhodanese-like domain-containing protein [Nitrosopumilaceae archaeon]